MAYEIRVGPTEPRYTHHIKLSLNSDEMGLILCDEKGDADHTALQHDPYPRNALKTSTGDDEYSDQEQPYKTISQDEWDGGRGMKYFEDDVLRFFDSFRVNTYRKGGMILGGLQYYCKGYRDQDYVMPGLSTTQDGLTWQSLLTTTQYISRSFSASATYDADKVVIPIRKFGSPTGNITVKIAADTGGDINWASPLKTVTLAVSELTDTITYEWEFDWTTTTTLTQSTTYWVGISHTAGDATNYIQVGCQDTSAGERSSDGSSWASFDKGLYFRVTDADADFIAHFFEYKDQLYFATQPDAGGAGAVYMSGYRGCADSNTGALNRLNDSGTDWSGLSMTAAIAKAVAGPGFDEFTNWRAITNSYDGYITVSPNWNTTHTTKTEYVILGYDTFVALTSTGITKPITSVAVANNIIYFAQGNLAHVRQHMERNAGDGTWTDSYWESTNAYAHFLKVSVDAMSGQILWIARNDRDFDYVGKLVKDIAPKSWGTSPLSGQTLDDGLDSWNEKTVTNVTPSLTNGMVTFTILNGVVSAITLNAGGSGYSVDDVLTLVQDNAVACTATVTSVAGTVVDGISLTTAGSGYATGSALVTTVEPDNGTGCTVDIDTVSSFGSGIIGTESISSIDLRNSKTIYMLIKTNVSMAAGDLQLLLDDTAQCASPVFSVNLPGIPSNRFYQLFVTLEDAFTTVGADAIVSIGLKLVNSKAAVDINGITTIEMVGGVWAGVDFDPIDISGGKITGLELYGEPVEDLWVFTETGYGPVQNDKYKPVPGPAIKSVASMYNGIGHCVSGVYLFFSLGYWGGVERFYRQKLDDVGPDRDDGMPSDRRGPGVFFYPYAGDTFFMAVDGGVDNYSSVMFYDGGWHEVYRAPRTGERIREVYVHVIDGPAVDRLYISQGSDVIWIPIDLNPRTNSNYKYTHEGHFITGRIHGKKHDVEKFWNSIKLSSENLTANVNIQAAYREDNDTAWTPLGTTFTTSPYQEVSISEDMDKSGKWFQIRFQLNTNSYSSTPELYTWILELLMIVDVKTQYTLTFRLKDRDTDLAGMAEEDGDVDTKETLIKAWLGGKLPVTMNSISTMEDDKTLFVMPGSYRRIKKITDDAGGGDTYICRMTLLEA